MTDAVTYSVVSNGGVKEGFDMAAVQEAVAELFKLTPEKAQAIVQKRCILRKNVDLKLAEAYKRKLENIGLHITLREHVSEKSLESATAAAAAETHSPNQPETPVKNIAATPPSPVEVKQEAPLAADEMRCPKCELRQAKAEECKECGIFVQKYLERQYAQENAESREVERATMEPQTYHDEPAAGWKIYLGALIAAVLGALLWKFIAVSFDREFGIIAWLIGGAIGFAAAVAGARGQNAGLVCGALALVAIMGGKYLAMSTFQDQFAQSMAEVVDIEDTDMRQLYQEELMAAKRFTVEVIDEESMREFMVNYGYSEYADAEYVTEEEMQWFAEYTQPVLQNIALSDPSYDEWVKLSMDGVVNISTSDLVAESLGFIDIFFLFLGVGTAFRLGRGE